MTDRAFEFLVCAVAVFVAVLVLGIAAYRQRAERAAYLEGRYGISHAVAWQMAAEK